MTVPNIAVFGLYHGWKFVECLKSNSFANLTAVADLDSEKLNRIGKDVEIYRDYKELIKKTKGKIDGIIAALPNNLHVEVTELAAKFGLPLMLEKPIACNTVDADKIIKIVNDSKIKFMVGHHRRFSKRVIRVKEVIEKGRLGRIVGINVVWTAKKLDEYFKQKWRVTKDVGGVLLINGIHDVDLLRYLIGEIELVQACATNISRGNQVEDTGAIILKFKNGVVATIFLTDNSPSPWYYEMDAEEYSYSYLISFTCYQFFGDKASLTFPKMDMFYYKEDPNANWHRTIKYEWPQPIKYERLEVDNFNVIEEEVKHFCEMIKGNAISKVTAEDAAQSLRIIEAIKKSSRLEKAVYLDDMNTTN